MFRCTECQAEYETKPDYCDCGNDTFDEIITEKQPEEPKKEEKVVEKKVEPKVEKPVEIKQEIKQEVKPEVKPEIKMPEKEVVKEISIPKVQVQKQAGEISQFAWIFFAVCMILSLLVIFVIGNPSPESETQTQKTETVETTKMPSINSLWNNEAPKVQAETKTVEPEQQPQEIQTPTEPKVVQPEAKKKSVNNKQPEQKVQKQTKNNTKVTQNTQNAQKVTQNTQKTTPTVNKQELANYKIGLRNKIASKIDFARVVGDGSCTVSFKISSNGQLTNRNFAVQSENSSLNDVVYNAMMQTPYFSAPPQSYRGETLKLSVRIYSGSFEVDLR